MTAPNPRTPGWSHHWRTGWSHDWRNSGPITLAELLPSGPIPLAGDTQTGEIDVEALRRRAAHAGPIEQDTLLYRVEFHVAQTNDDDR